MERNCMVLFLACWVLAVIAAEKKVGTIGRNTLSQDELQDVSFPDDIVIDKHSRFPRQASTKKVPTTLKKKSTVKATSKKGKLVASTTKKKTTALKKGSTVRSSSKKPTTVKYTTKKRTTLVRSTSTTKKVTVPSSWLREDTPFSFNLLDMLSSSTTALTTQEPLTTLPPEDDTTDVYSEPTKEYPGSSEQNDVEEDSDTPTHTESCEDSPVVDKEPSVVIPASESSTVAAGSSIIPGTTAKSPTKKSTLRTPTPRRRQIHVSPRQHRYFNGFSFARRYRGQKWGRDRF